jgi:hypothetical protein
MIPVKIQLVLFTILVTLVALPMLQRRAQPVQ